MGLIFLIILKKNHYSWDSYGECKFALKLGGGGGTGAYLGRIASGRREELIHRWTPSYALRYIGPLKFEVLFRKLASFKSPA